MAMVHAAREALESARKSFPKAPRIQRLMVEDEIDMEGRDALRMIAVMPDDTRDDEIAGGHTLDLNWAIYQALQAKGISLFPYVFYATERELAEEAEERAREAAG